MQYYFPFEAKEGLLYCMDRNIQIVFSFATACEYLKIVKIKPLQSTKM
jgi:hypothetical protein